MKVKVVKAMKKELISILKKENLKNIDEAVELMLDRYHHCTYLTVGNSYV